MEDRDRRIGYWVSGIAHLALILWALLGGVLLRPQPATPIRMTEVATMSGAEFEAYAAAARGAGPVGQASTAVATIAPPADDSAGAVTPADSPPPDPEDAAQELAAPGSAEPRPDLSDFGNQTRVDVASDLPDAPAPPLQQDRGPEIPVTTTAPTFTGQPDRPSAAEQDPTAQPVAPRSALALNRAARPLDRPDGLVAAFEARIAAREAAEAAAEEAARSAARAAADREAADREAAQQRQAAEAQRRAAEARAEAEAEAEAANARRAAEERAAEQRAAEQAARDAAARQAAEQQAAEDRAAEERAAEQRAAEQRQADQARRAQAERDAAERAATERAEAERQEREQAEAAAAAERAARQRAEDERRATEQAAREEQQRRETAEREAAAREAAAREAAAREAREREAAAREAAERQALEDALREAQQAGADSGDSASAQGATGSDSRQRIEGGSGASAPQDPLAAALSGAMSQGVDQPAPETAPPDPMQLAPTSTTPRPITPRPLPDPDQGAAATTDDGGAAPLGQPLSLSEREQFRVAIQQCWNIGALSLEAARMDVSVEFRMAPDGRPDAGSLRLVDQRGGSQFAAQNAFEVARRAIMMCGRNGYALPPEKYGRWREVIVDFRPDGIGFD